MKIQADAHMAYPRALCFSTYRDRLPELVPHLPNVRAIEVEEREETPGGVEGQVRLLNIWRAVSEIPKVAQALVKPEMLAWHDHALWDENEWTCAWRVETHFFKDRISCRGKNQFVDQGDSCLLQIRGDLDIDLKGMKGVPRVLAGKLGATVEKFVVALLTPNLTSVSTGLEAFLREQEKTAD
jgi:hypothetical protein